MTMRKNILFVDDEPLVARLYARAAASIGYDSNFAEDGSLALEMVEGTPPSFIISDMNMPGMGGVEMVEALSHHNMKTMPVLMLSATHGAEVIARGLRAGVDDFLVKGISFEQLIDRMRFWMEGPFHGLPQAARAEAQERLRDYKAPDDPLLLLNAPRELLLSRARIAVYDQLLGLPKDFGDSAADRERLLGVMTGLLSLLGRTDPLSSLRRADHILALLRSLGPEWPGKLWRELGAIDDIAALPTFQHAAQTLQLRP